MRFRTLEIRWHDSKPISTCDFQPVSFKKARPPAGQENNYTSHSYRLATGGEDNHVRIWMVHPYIRPPNVMAEADASSAATAARQPRVEYLATLSRHSAAVNVVRFSPNGELIASAGDDGMIIIWAPSVSPQATTYGSDLSPEDLQHEKEYWKPRTTFRCTTMQVYDLAWSPTGEYIVAGSTDNTARVFTINEGKCVCEIAEHSHYVQGVAWDPLNEYIATQSSDRSMHIYRITTKPGGIFEAHAVGKNTKMPHRHSHSRTPSAHGGARPRMFRRESTASDMDTSAVDLSEEAHPPTKDTPLTPATSVSSTPAFMFPPPPIEASSRRSSFSSNAPGSPSTFSNSRYGRSPSPMPPLPAIRSPLPPSNATTALWASVKLYGDESFTNFFRRLTFSPDGGLLLTPAGQFEDPSVLPGSITKQSNDDTPMRGRKGHPSEAHTLPSASSSSSTSSVYIYSRANFARPPIAQLPGHKKASVAVKFSPVLYELRPSVIGPVSHETQEHDPRPPTAALDTGIDGKLNVDLTGPIPGVAHPEQTSSNFGSSSLLLTPHRTPLLQPHGSIATPVPKAANSNAGAPAASPALSPVEVRPPTPAASKPSTPHPPANHTLPQVSSTPAQGSTPTITAPPSASIFALPYRMLFAVLTMDTVAIYDTQQAGPVCLLTKLHYDEFTDMTWSPDGQCLILSSRDGYCTLIVFDDILPAHHTQQHTLQLQSIAHNHCMPLITSSNTHSNQVTPAATPASSSISLPPFTMAMPPSSSSQPPPNPKKRSDPPLTPAASVDGSESSFFLAGQSQGTQDTLLSEATSSAGGEAKSAEFVQEPPKKKRRVALTRVGDLDT
ncbi:WD40-repeat-containing domain protein [Panaeolus papilionaceus]|nr:WD40-repeat-containing domain protein [Panaeolus papilionaceus]